MYWDFYDAFLRLCYCLTKMNQDVLSLTQALVCIPSVSRDGNEAVTRFLQDWLEQQGFDVETLVYQDVNGVSKYSLVAKLGQGSGGLGFFSHSDTVPAAENEWPAFDANIKDGKLYGRGSCDMKGPLAASMIAALQIDKNKLKKPIYIGISADEESGFGGVQQIVSESKHFAKSGFPEMGVIPEPSELKPIYAHKGGYWMVITARAKLPTPVLIRVKALTFQSLRFWQKWLHSKNAL